ncbi:hypothetical protein J2R99_000281 [Rhodopseudomonas julia]|uniref:DUF992 domain-containing protein n=1 Tax=Rhodopseudomonas julia TaxID=200617 RepID=A0ABU0C1N9_9BRAD|nr:DUF992 domain-containing protein [Rhodopseudomonas julia]MDQ0324432.1 hypothetical protein [Rhodopseudomonas julia]
MKKVLTTLLLAAGLAIPSVASAQDRVEIGALDCTVEGGTGFIIGSSKELTCTFTPREGGPQEAYAGTVKKFGLDVGVTKESFIKWLVLAPTRDAYTRGALAGEYAGVGAEATVGGGVGANVLIGGSNKSYALQPLSVQAQKGLNLAVGFQSFTLRPLIQ